MTSSTGGSYTPPPPPSTGGPSPTGGGAAGGELIYPSSPPKDPVLVLVLNLLLIGAVGYFIIGQWQKAVVAAVLWILLGLPTCFTAGLLVAIFAAIDGMYQAQELQAGRPIAQWTFFHDHR